MATAAAAPEGFECDGTTGTLEEPEEEAASHVVGTSVDELEAGVRIGGGGGWGHHDGGAFATEDPDELSKSMVVVAE